MLYTHTGSVTNNIFILYRSVCGIRFGMNANRTGLFLLHLGNKTYLKLVEISYSQSLNRKTCDTVLNFANRFVTPLTHTIPMNSLPLPSYLPLAFLSRWDTDTVQRLQNGVSSSLSLWPQTHRKTQSSQEDSQLPFTALAGTVISTTFTFRSFSRRSYPERRTVSTGILSPRQVGWSALPKDTTSYGAAGNQTNNLLIHSPTP